MSVTVLAPGARTLFQDAGRVGLSHLGIVASGPFDELAMLAANSCVGNRIDATVLECVLTGPTLRFERAALLAVVGGGFRPTLDGSPFATGEPIDVRSGQILEVGAHGDGLRCVVAVRGGFAPEPVLGSRAQHSVTGIGPPASVVGCTIPIGAQPLAHVPGDHAAPRTIREPRREARLRILLTDDAPPVGDAWVVTPRADRVGVRLEPEDGPLARGDGCDPQPSPLGAIQLPPDGMPIILGPDRPATGGYRLIGAVCRADLGVLAQSPPGKRLTIERIGRDAALRAWQDAARAWSDASI